MRTLRFPGKMENALMTKIRPKSIESPRHSRVIRMYVCEEFTEKNAIHCRDIVSVSTSSFCLAAECIFLKDGQYGGTMLLTLQYRSSALFRPPVILQGRLLTRRWGVEISGNKTNRRDSSFLIRHNGNAIRSRQAIYDISISIIFLNLRVRGCARVN